VKNVGTSYDLMNLSSKIKEDYARTNDLGSRTRRNAGPNPENQALMMEKGGVVGTEGEDTFNSHWQKKKKSPPCQFLIVGIEGAQTYETSQKHVGNKGQTGQKSQIRTRRTLKSAHITRVWINLSGTGPGLAEGSSEVIARPGGSTSQFACNVISVEIIAGQINDGGEVFKPKRAAKKNRTGRRTKHPGGIPWLRLAGRGQHYRPRPAHVSRRR